MGEVVGVGLGGSMFVFGGLVDETMAPIGAAYRYDEASAKSSQLTKMPEPAHHLMQTTHY